VGLFIKGKRDEVSEAVKTAERRAARLTQAELLAWGETSLYAIGKNLMDFQRGGDFDWEDASLLEAQAQEAVLAVVLGELRTRLDASRP
jgi:hypothetical protein